MPSDASAPLVRCPICSGPAVESLDADGDLWTSCDGCQAMYVTPAYGQHPTLTYPLPDMSDALEAVKAESRATAR